MTERTFDYALDCTDCGQMFVFATKAERQTEYERKHLNHETEFFRQARV